jgi:hypothetical protein
VWIPVSQQGILAVIGGVKYPEDIYPAGLSTSQQEQDVGQTRHPWTKKSFD